MSTPSDTSRPTRRVVSGAAEEWVGRKIQCLDHGFVYLVDYMGGDEAIVQAARVSYGLGTKTLHEDRGLIRYLMRHQHTTPFEMVELKFHVKLPIFVARQWIRHRTACLAGDVDLVFDLPGARKRGRRAHYRVDLEKFHRLWHSGTRHVIPKKKPLYLDRVIPEKEYTIRELWSCVQRRAETLRNLIRVGTIPAKRIVRSSPNDPTILVLGADWYDYAAGVHMARVPMRERLKQMHLRMCNESTGEIEHTRVVDVWETGIKPVFKVTLANGYTIKMTKDHRCLTEDGWRTLEQAAAPRVTDGGGVTWNAAAPAFAVNGTPVYRQAAWLAEQRKAGFTVSEIADRAGTSYHTIRKYLKHFRLQFDAAERSRLSGLVQRGQKRTFRNPRRFTDDHLRAIRFARSGQRSNFWKGGISPERANVGRWTREHAARVHAKHGYRCALCARTDSLVAHHIDPVWHNAARARDFDNLISLCSACHSRLHAQNLELEFLAAFQSGQVESFWDGRVPAPRPHAKSLPRTPKLARSFSRIERIEFAGHEMTYDIAVAGPFHNFVANGFVVHNSVNEYSGRYSVMPDEFYVPAAEHVTRQSTGNRQGGGESIDAARSAQVLDIFEREQRLVRDGYQQMLGWDIRRELARINLGVSQYTEWYWKNDLHNTFHFLKLRLDEHAQYEIKVYAEAMARIVAGVAPLAWEAFRDYQLEAEHFSRLELETLARLLGLQRPWPDERSVHAALPDPWREVDAEGRLKRNRERDEFLGKLRRMAGK